MSTVNAPERVTPALMRKAYDSLAPTAVALLNSDQCLRPQLIMLDVTDAGTLASVYVMPPDVVHTLHSEKGKTFIPRFINDMLRQRACDIVVHLCESVVLDATRESVSSMLRAGAHPKDIPGSYDCVYIAVHTRSACPFSTMKIETTPEGKRHVKLAPLEFPEHSIQGATLDQVDALRKALAEKDKAKGEGA